MQNSFKLMIIFAILFGVASTGCNRPNDSSSEVLIYGGLPVSSDEWHSVVAITRRDAEGSHFIECTGTLFSPKHIVTAGHCLDQPDLIANVPDAIATLGIYLGSGSEGGKVTEVLPVKSVAVHGSLRLHPSGNSDIAIIELVDPVTTVTPAKLLASIDLFQDLMSTKPEGKLLGFGRREDGGHGLKFMADAKIRDVEAWESIAGADGKDSCTGDSGGPSFVANPKGQWLQYGIVSRSWTFECGKGGFMTNLAPHACWIEKQSGISLSGTATQCRSFNVTYSDRELSAMNFGQICAGKSSNRFQKETIRRLKRHFKTESCLELKSFLSEKTLKLDDLLLRDLSPLAPFRQIESLALTGNLVTHAEVLNQLTNLKSLNIETNDIQDPAGALAPLVTAGTRISGLHSQLNNYAKTTFAALCGKADLPAETQKTMKSIFAKTMAENCSVANSRLLMIKTLRLSDRNLSDLTPLENLPSVVSLDLSGNPVADLTSLAGLENMRFLNIENTLITDLSPLDHLVSQGLEIKR